MDPFKQIPGFTQTWREFLKQCRASGLSKEAARNTYPYMKRCAHFVNSEYHVAVDYEPEHGFEGMTLAHLSIKRHDREPVHDWRILQEIKNEIVGPQIEAIEIYPKESRLVDTANQYHLYAFMGGETVPCGFFERSVTDDPNFGNAKQRPRSRA